MADVREALRLRLDVTNCREGEHCRGTACSQRKPNRPNEWCLWCLADAALASQQPEAPEDGGVLGYVVIRRHRRTNVVSLCWPYQTVLLGKMQRERAEEVAAGHREAEPWCDFSVEPVGRAAQQAPSPLEAQVREAIAILEGGSEYERLHVAAILENGLAAQPETERRLRSTEAAMDAYANALHALQKEIVERGDGDRYGIAVVRATAPEPREEP